MPRSFFLFVLAFVGIPLAITVVIESVTAWFMRLRDMRSLLAVLLINVVSNPATNIAVLTLGRHRTYPGLDVPLLVTIELAVVVVEAALLKYALRLDARRALSVSFFMNLASAVLGLLILAVALPELF